MPEAVGSRSKLASSLLLLNHPHRRPLSASHPSHQVWHPVGIQAAVLFDDAGPPRLLLPHIPGIQRLLQQPRRRAQLQGGRGGGWVGMGRCCVGSDGFNGEDLAGEEWGYIEWP